MNNEQLRTLFANRFDYARFIPFCLDVLGVRRSDLAVRPELGTPIVYDKDEVLDAREVATVERGGWKVGVLVCKLAKGSTITRPIGLRKLVEPLVRYHYDAAIAVFCKQGPDDPEWRLSFVENLPKDGEARRNARRYTYVFGHHDELYRTPVGNFLDLQGRPEPRKDFFAYRAAFSVEALGDRFFKDYKAIYEDFVQEITGRRYLPVKGKSNTFEEAEVAEASPFFAAVFDNDGKAVRDYVKKMMGRLVFLQFLQKKGWMGVPKGERWDAHKGERRYLQKLFEAYCGQTPADRFNFLEDILEPLFFNALNTDRSGQGDVAEPALWLAPDKPIRIPFLSGSLFERDAIDAKECRFGRAHFAALFDLFDQFNFTIDESDPSDAEIGIAPDMLGRIFENLLEDNKDKGAFYTPHEVVRYMCQEALLAYLGTATGLDRTLLESLVRDHLFADDRPAIRAALKDAIEKVRICDPAIGSGAFPMGMLHELLACHKALAREASKSADSRRDAFTQIKRHIIANNIYGVDIEQGAVDIARLRFWLSLVIDEKEPSPLPNLDYKIVRGDSLCAMYDGEPIDLNKGPGIKAAVAPALRQYQGLVAKFTEATGEARVAKRREVNLALLDALEAYYTTTIAAGAHFEQGTLGFIPEQENLPAKSVAPIDLASTHMLAKVRALRARILAGSTEPVPFFDWQVNCSDILGKPCNVNGLPCYERGFDIVIGNPPYIHLEKTKALGARLSNAKFLTYAPRGDIYCLFYEKGLSLLREQGILCYITSNKWMRGGYGDKLRAFFANHAKVRLLLDFAGAKIFDTATVDTNILLAERTDVLKKDLPQASATRACLAQEGRQALLADLPAYVRAHAHEIAFPADGSSWAILSPIEQAIKAKIEKYGTPLKDWDVSINYGVKTGLNEAFILDGKTKDRLIAQDPKSAEILRPILRGRDIKRYGYTFADKWLIATHNGYGNTPRVNITHYPAVKAWLDTFGDKLRKRTDKGDTPYNLRDCAYWSLFSQPKIIWGELARTGTAFSYDEHAYYVSNTAYFLTLKNSTHIDETFANNLFSMLGVLNSSLMLFYLDNISSKLDATGWRWLNQFVMQLPLCPVNGRLAWIARNILSNHTKTSRQECEDFVFDLYHITHDERQFLHRRYASIFH